MCKKKNNISTEQHCIPFLFLEGYLKVFNDILKNSQPTAKSIRNAALVLFQGFYSLTFV